MKDKTILPTSILNDINTFLYIYQQGRLNLGQIEDSTEGKGIWYDTKVFGNYKICFRFCSPGHLGDSASIYWYVIIEENEN